MVFSLQMCSISSTANTHTHTNKLMCSMAKGKQKRWHILIIIGPHGNETVQAFCAPNSRLFRMKCVPKQCSITDRFFTRAPFATLYLARCSGMRFFSFCLSRNFIFEFYCAMCRLLSNICIPNISSSSSSLECIFHVLLLFYTRTIYIHKKYDRTRSHMCLSVCVRVCDIKISTNGGT